MNVPSATRSSLCFVVCLAVIVLNGQAAAFAQEQPVAGPSAQARQRLYEEIAAEVAELERRGNLLKKVVRLVKPTVVHIEANKTEVEDNRRRRVQEAGSGVIISFKNKHYVITNRHVITGAPNEKIDISLDDGRLIHPYRVWTDPETDLAVMGVDAENLIAARLGNSDNLEIGDFVLAVGSPFGLSHSVTYGIISAKGRRDLSLGREGVRYQDFIQTDAAINPGNGGGPLMNLRGEVVGINTAIASSGGGNEGIGFTIPINMAKHVTQQLITRGSVVRAFFGVHLDSRFTPEAAVRLGLPVARGARVTGITPNSPAETADVQVGDVIMKFNGVSVEDDSHLVNLVSLTPVGSEIALAVWRDGETHQVKVKVGRRSDFERRN